MTDGQALVTLQRLQAIDWSGDWDYAFEHAQSRRLLMHEYLRRSALWAKAVDAEKKWPFFDVTEHIDTDLQFPSEFAAALDKCLKRAAYSSRATCRGAVRFAELRAQGITTMPNLPDPYEPLILFYERGGEFLQDGAGFVDLTGVSIKLKSLQDHLTATPFLTFRAATLDALDAEGSISYYSTADGRTLVMRRRIMGGSEHRDESFTAALRWQPTDELCLSEKGASDRTYVRIGDIEAAKIVDTIAEPYSA